MTATQTQHRRGTSTQCDAMTPAVGEFIFDTTNNRIRAGDGVTLGGIVVPKMADMLFATPNFAVAGGSANALTVTIDANAALTQPLFILFRATNTNSGAATLTVNALTTKNLYKISGGTVTALAAGDIVSGGLYLAFYDGTQFQVYGLQDTGLTDVSQGDLNTSTGTFSGSCGSLTNIASNYYVPAATGGTLVTLPGGEYGFHVLTGQNSADNDVKSMWIPCQKNSITKESKVTPFATSQGGGSPTVTGSQRYVTSSPPFDEGDGETGGYIFVMVDGDGKPVAHYAADVPPWAYNGPTNIRCAYKDKGTGKKYRLYRPKLTPQQFMDGVSPKAELQEITQEMKRADRALIPHPFGQLPVGHSVVLLDPMSDKIKRLVENQNLGDADLVFDLIYKGYLKIDNERITRKGPPGVMITAAKFTNRKGV